MKTFILSLSLMLCVSLQAQISGKVLDTAGTPLAGATLSLLHAKDSSQVKLAISETDGSWSFLPETQGKYLVKASFTGYGPSFSQPIEWFGEENHTKTFSLQPLATQLATAVIDTRKPLIDVKQDKIVVNVEGTLLSTGTDALDLLRKSPGVFIDKDDQINMNGKNGVQVFIDGKPSPLKGKDLANFLRSLQSSQISNIELITNPSAKYEAAGNAGIINIRLKKNMSLGLNGSVNAGYRIGKYGKFNSGFSLNYRNKRVNIFGNYDFDKDKNENQLMIQRFLKDSIFLTPSVTTTENNRHNFKTGVDVFINKQNIIGAMVNGNLADGLFHSTGTTSIEKEFVKNQSTTLNRSNTDRDNLSYNLNYQFSGATGKSLTVNADFAEYHSRGIQSQKTTAGPDVNPYTRMFEIHSPSDIFITSGKVDWEQNLAKGRLSAGIKSSFVHSDNDFRQYDLKSGSPLLDGQISNHFLYKEDIQAAYAIFNRRFKGFGFQAGLRAERTSSNGTSHGYDGRADQIIKKAYTDLFPSASVTFNKNPMKQVSFSYSRRIDRPSYQQLNPFELRMDEYTIVKGNLNLKPQYTNNFGVSFLYRYKLSAALNYSHVNNMMAPLTDTTDHNKLVVTTDNLASQDVVSLNLSYPFQYKKLSLFTNVNTSYSKYDADFGAGRHIHLDAIAFNAVVQGSLAMGKGWTAQLTSFYSAPTVYQGSFRAQSLWSVDLGIQRQFLQDKMSVKATLSDVFNSLHFVGKTNFAGQKTTIDSRWESRQFKINLSYRFGRKEIKPSRQRKAGLDEESNRVKSTGGGINIGQ